MYINCKGYNMYNTASTRMLTTSNSAVYLQPLDLRDTGVHHQTLDLRRDHQTSERPTPGGIRRDWTTQKPSILASTGKQIFWFVRKTVRNVIKILIWAIYHQTGIYLFLSASFCVSILSSLFLVLILYLLLLLLSILII